MKLSPHLRLLAASCALSLLASAAGAAASYTFPSFNVGTLTGGGTPFTKALDVSGITNAEYLFVRVTAVHLSGAAPHDGWSSTVKLELNNGAASVYWPTSTATLGAMAQDGTSSLIWAGMFPRSSYVGGSNLTFKLADTFTDSSGPYYSTVSNVVITLYPAPTPAKTFAAFDVGQLTGGGAAFTKSLDVSTLPAVEYLFARVAATHTSGAAPHDGWSSTINMELNNGGTMTYWPSNTATYGALSQDGVSGLLWPGVLPQSSYPGESNLTVKFFDSFTDNKGPYYSTISNVVVTIYPAPTPAKTFAAFNVGTLTGGGAAFTKSLDVSGMSNSEYLFARITATHTSGATPHDAWSNTLDLELSDGASTVYWPSNTATLGAKATNGVSNLIWSGLLPKNTYRGGNNLTIKFVDTFTDANGPYSSGISNVVVTLYPASSAPVAAPWLALSRAGAKVILSWPNTAAGFVLQSATNLAPATDWTTVSPAPVVVNSRYTVTNSVAGLRTFYRLTQ